MKLNILLDRILTKDRAVKLPEAVSCVTQCEEGDDEDRQRLYHSLPPLPHQPHHGAGQQVPGLFLITKPAAASCLVTSDFTSLHITFLRYAHVKPSRSLPHVIRSESEP